MVFDLARAMWTGVEIEELTDEETEEEESPIWKDGLYIGDLRPEDKYPLECITKFDFKKRHLDFYVNDYMRKYKEVEADI